MTDPLPLDSAWASLLELAAGRPAAPHPHTLWGLYAPIASAPAFVIGQIGQSLDGRVATPTAKSRNISGPDAIRHLHRLRALVDAVVVGVGTVIADDPLLSVRDVAGLSPIRVVIDPNFRLPKAARLLRDSGAPVFAIQSEPRARDGDLTSISIPSVAGTIPPQAIVAALAEKGIRRLLVEGGPATLSAFLAAGALDRLHVSVAPIILGSGPVGINLPPIDELTEALHPRASRYEFGDDTVFDCDLTRGSSRLERRRDM
jgi:diaminohydroxyphosphoribosylaminopyrimidine deaminase/5-amino-6-(5-phosphoribosylamino)uracil reductase